MYDAKIQELFHYLTKEYNGSKTPPDAHKETSKA